MLAAMTLNRNRYRIESTRLSHWNYSSPAWYLVTICTKDRRTYFAEVVEDSVCLSATGRIVAEEWRKTAAIRPNVDLDEFVVTPNHFHGIVIITPSADGHAPRVETPRRGVSTMPRLQVASLGSIIEQFKIACTKRIWAAGSGLQMAIPLLRSHHSGEASLDAIRRYIRENPAKWVLDQENPDNRR